MTQITFSKTKHADYSSEQTKKIDCGAEKTWEAPLFKNLRAARRDRVAAIWWVANFGDRRRSRFDKVNRGLKSCQVNCGAFDAVQRFKHVSGRARHSLGPYWLQYSVGEAAHCESKYSHRRCTEDRTIRSATQVHHQFRNCDLHLLNYSYAALDQLILFICDKR